MSWGQEPDDNDRDASRGWDTRPSQPPPPDLTSPRDPHNRRNPQLGRDPQWGRDPGRDSLRPLDLGDVLDGMFRLARRHWKAYAIGLGVVVVPLSLLSGLVFAQMFGSTPGLLESIQNPELLESTEATPSPTEMARVAVTGALSALASLLLTPLIYGVAVRVAATGYRTGEVDPMTSVRTTLRRYPALLGALFLVWLISFGLVLVPLILVGIGAASESAPLLAIGGIGALVGLVAAVIALTRLSLVVPAVIVERAGAAGALRRSNALVKGRTGVVFGTLLVIGIIVLIISNILTLPFQLGILGGGQSGAVLTTVGAIISSLVSNALYGGAFVLIYFDRRVRAEGYDLSELANELGDHPDPRW